MDLKRCINGHFYDGDDYPNCPYCGAEGVPSAPMQNMGGAASYVADEFEGNKTEKLGDFEDVYSNGSIPTQQETVSLQNIVDGVKDISDLDYDDDDDDQGKTISIFEASVGKNPVVGWLVCIEGPHFGEDFRLRAGKNFIGRSPSMDVCIKKDNGVSRERHLIVLYDPETNVFVCQSGDSKELSYHNDQLVLSSVELKIYDVLKVGSTKLMFIPLCGDKFSWDDKIN